MGKIVPHNRLTFGERECEAVAQVVRSGHWAQGPRVQELEAVLARMAGVKYAVCVASGLSALRLALGALGIQSSDPVIVPAYCCVALPNSVLSWGANPVPAEIEAKHWNLDATVLRRATSDLRPRAAIVVNTFGAPADVDQIRATGDHVPIIEDCAHAFGFKFGEKWLGSRGDIGVLSFYATKLIGGGEGGAVLTDSEAIANFVRSARDYADQPADAHRVNDKMNDLEAALVLAQLERLPEMIAARQELAIRYLDGLAQGERRGAYRLPAPSDQRIWYRFAVEMLHVPAQKVVGDLRAAGIYADIPVADWRCARGPAAPVADRAYGSLVSLPIFPTLTREEQDAVVSTFLSLCQSHVNA